MAINNFIPSVWSETLYCELEKEYIAVKNCSREFEGEIKGKGDAVNICGIGNVSVFNYSKNTDMTAAETLSDSVRSLVINQAKAFNFQIDDIDRAQQSPKIMSAAMAKAAAALADCADRYVYSLYTEIPPVNTITKSAVTFDNIIDIAISARKALLMSNVSSGTETVLEVTPEIASLILKAKILTSDVNGAAIDAGYIGSLIGFRVYVSNNVLIKNGYHKCLARTRRAVAFAEQLSEIDAYRPEKRFADAVKGLHLYGAKVVYSNEIVLLDLSTAS